MVRINELIKDYRKKDSLLRKGGQGNWYDSLLNGLFIVTLFILCIGFIYTNNLLVEIIIIVAIVSCIFLYLYIQTWSILWREKSKHERELEKIKKDIKIKKNIEKTKKRVKDNL